MTVWGVRKVFLSSQRTHEHGNVHDGANVGLGDLAGQEFKPT